MILNFVEVCLKSREVSRLIKKLSIIGHSRWKNSYNAILQFKSMHRLNKKYWTMKEYIMLNFNSKFIGISWLRKIKKAHVL